MLKAIIVEDEELLLSEIKTMVQETGFINVVGAYSKALTVLAEVELVQPQLAFIDIGLPDMDGITLAERILEKLPNLQVVFITAYNDYAVKAFELNALDYLLKPIELHRFRKMVERIDLSAFERNNFSQKLLEIQCFGDLEVKIGGESVKWVRSKAEELFCILLMNHGSRIHKETILETLWPDTNPKRALPLLQTSVCKLRNIFSSLPDKVKLEYASSKYRLMITECVCDLFFVEDVLRTFSAGDVNNYALLERAGQIIRQGFLHGQGYLWAAEREEQMRNKLCDLLRTVTGELLVKVDCSSAVDLLKLLLEIEPYYEEANNQLLKCYATINDSAGIIDHYKWLERVLRADYDMEPPKSTRELYKKLYAEKFVG